MPRVKSFDPDTVLERAVEQFWQAGYDGTSMTMLLASMGISRQSLYDTFGDKRNLFLSSLERYRLMVLAGLQAKLGESGSAKANIRAAFEWISEVVLGRPERRSCLMANASLELGRRDADVQAQVSAHLEAIEDSFFSVLERARVEGELDPNKQPRALARFLTNAIHGLGILARGGAEPAVLHDAIEVTLAAI